jgi:hypothetical protein
MVGRVRIDPRLCADRFPLLLLLTLTLSPQAGRGDSGGIFEEGAA